MSTTAIRDRFVGCLVGGAAGDALGAPVEFLPRAQIVERFGDGGLARYSPAYGRLGAITDDTQMTMFTAEGLLRGHVRRAVHGATWLAEPVSHAYLRWLVTQGQRPARSGLVNERERGWLFGHRALHEDRASGGTCISSLAAMVRLGERAHNNSKGCGGVMRTAPVGLYAWHERAEHGAEGAFDLGVELAALTHGHPTGSLTAGVLSAAILRLLDGVSIAEAVGEAKEILVRRPHHEETLEALALAERLAASPGTRHQDVRRIGLGWVAEEALGIALYCALVAEDFRDGVVVAVNHDGDSDSTGAITGNLLGAALGPAAIPESWVEPLELCDVITELATDLYDCASWPLDDEAFVSRITRKYPAS